MKVKALIEELCGVDVEPRTEAEEEALGREVLVYSGGNQETSTIEDVKYDGVNNRVIIEIE